LTGTSTSTRWRQPRRHPPGRGYSHGRGITRHFSIVVQKADRRTRELNSSWKSGRRLILWETSRYTAEFWTGFFDFPMIDNTRLANDQRCSVVVNSFEDNSADITLVYFPAHTRAEGKAVLPGGGTEADENERADQPTIMNAIMVSCTFEC